MLYGIEELKKFKILQQNDKKVELKRDNPDGSETRAVLSKWWWSLPEVKAAIPGIVEVDIPQLPNMISILKGTAEITCEKSSWADGYPRSLTRLLNLDMVDVDFSQRGYTLINKNDGNVLHWLRMDLCRDIEIIEQTQDKIELSIELITGDKYLLIMTLQDCATFAQENKLINLLAKLVI